MRRGFVAVLLVVAALWVSVATQVGPAFGHANQARSEPSPDSVLETAPMRVAVWFTEPHRARPERHTRPRFPRVTGG